MSANSAAETIDTLCELLQRAHFAARGLQQHVPDDGGETLADQLHRIRMLAGRLKAQLAEAQEA